MLQALQAYKLIPMNKVKGIQLNRLLVAGFTFFITACTIMDTSVIQVGEKRSPTDPQKVVIYASPPAKFQEVAIISVTAGHDFRSEQGLTDSAIERLKLEASKVGANGVILKSTEKPSSGGVAIAMPMGNGMVGAVSGSGSRGGKTLSGIAIFVGQ